MWKQSKKQKVTGTYNTGIIEQNIFENVVIHSQPTAPLPLIYTLPSSNTYFQGRVDVQNKIYQEFKKEKGRKLVVLYGPGGIGKTSIAYKIAEKQKEMRVLIRIRTESQDIIKDDFSQVAKLLSIDVIGKNLEEIADLVNQKLVTTYKKGVIVFDNVHCYKRPFESVRSEEVTLSRFFPKEGNFLILATTRNKQFWPQGSLVEVSDLDPTSAVNLFENISCLKLNEQNMHQLLEFFHNSIGRSPLAICQAASYIQHKGITLEEYISRFSQVDSSIDLLKDTSSLPPELIFDGETPKTRQAIFTTYSLNIQSVQDTDPDFIKVLYFSALMQPDAILKEELYGMVSRVCVEFPNKKSDFESEVKKTSLLLFENTGMLTMHRIIQLVLLLKTNNTDSTIKSHILYLLDCFSKEFLHSRTAYANFAYFLRNIVNRKLFYKQVDVSDEGVIRSLLHVARAYKEVNENDQAVLFLTDAIKNVKMYRHSQLYEEIKNELLEILNTRFNLSNVSEEWLKELLQKVNHECSVEIIDVLLNKEKELTANFYRLNFKDDTYYPTIKAIANAIVFSLTNKPVRIQNAFDILGHKPAKKPGENSATANKQKELEQLASAHYILGRAFRENASGINTQIKNSDDRIESKKRTRNKYPVFYTVYGSISREIEELQEDVTDLEHQLTSVCGLAKYHLKQAINLRLELNQTDSYGYYGALRQAVLLYQFSAFNDNEGMNILDIATGLINGRARLENYENYAEVLDYSEKLMQKNRNSKMTAYF